MRENVSIIIPTYKEPDYLKICLDSILNIDPKYFGNVEIVVVVDGTQEINRHVENDFKSKCPVTFKWINLPTNTGLAHATNVGVMYSKFEYILIVNDDNVFEPHWYEKMEPLNKVTCFAQIEPGRQVDVDRKFLQRDFGTGASSFDKLKFNDFCRKYHLLPNTDTRHLAHHLPCLMSKQLFLQVGGWDPAYGSPHVCDIDFFKKIALCHNTNPFISTRSCLFYHFGGKATKNVDDAATAQVANFHEKERRAWDMYILRWKSFPIQYDNVFFNDRDTKK